MSNRQGAPTDFNVILLIFSPEILRGDVFARCVLPIVSSLSVAKDLDGNDRSKNVLLEDDTGGGCAVVTDISTFYASNCGCTLATIYIKPSPVGEGGSTERLAEVETDEVFAT